MRAGPSPSLADLVRQIEPILRHVAAIRTLHVEHAPTSGPAPVVGFASTTLPIPRPPGARALALTVQFESGCRPDGPTHQWLEALACLLGVACRHELADVAEPGPRAGEPVPAGVLDLMLGQSPAIEEVRRRVSLYASSDQPVLILGESGTGKELAARAIHEQSARRAGQFVIVNCPALVASLLEAELFGIEDRTATGVRGRKGKFEQANGGTLFLDEVADLSPQGQASLLRVLQERAIERVGSHRTIPVDLRIVAATNRQIAPTDEQPFRAELFYRLRVLPLRMPAVRERGDDAVDLVQAFLARDPRGWRWDLRPEAARTLLGCTWPANVRDLQAVAELIRLFARDEVVDDRLVRQVLAELDVAACPAVVGRPLTLHEAAAQHARSTLLSCDGNRTRACRQLGISPKTLRTYLRMPNEGTGVDSGRPAA